MQNKAKREKIPIINKMSNRKGKMKLRYRFHLYTLSHSNTNRHKRIRVACANAQKPLENGMHCYQRVNQPKRNVMRIANSFHFVFLYSSVLKITLARESASVARYNTQFIHTARERDRTALVRCAESEWALRPCMRAREKGIERMGE